MPRFPRRPLMPGAIAPKDLIDRPRELAGT